MTYQAYIFDLDGTLLDTLPDLVRITNMTLEHSGWPQRSRQEILSYVGDGGHMLLKRAAPPDATDDGVDLAFAYWQELYPEYGHALTKPYPGIPETLQELRDRGAKLGVLSNKFDGAAQDVIGRYFPGLFHVVRGECEEIPRKPDPRGLLHMMGQLGVQASQVAYVGDSGTDMAVARVAGAHPFGVSWGYRPVAELLDAYAELVVHEPHDLLLL